MPPVPDGLSKGQRLESQQVKNRTSKMSLRGWVIALLSLIASLLWLNRELTTGTGDFSVSARQRLSPLLSDPAMLRGCSAGRWCCSGRVGSCRRRYAEERIQRESPSPRRPGRRRDRVQRRFAVALAQPRPTLAGLISGSIGGCSHHHRFP